MNSMLMPQYKCHKIVSALKIAEVKPVKVRLVAGPLDFDTIVPVDKRYAEFEVSPEFLDKHQPKPGDYYVVYKDGYASISPARAFEDGYSLIEGAA